MTVEFVNGRVRITHNLVTIWVSEAEAEAAAMDQAKAAALLRRLQRR